jgi:hypothetical protein
MLSRRLTTYVAIGTSAIAVAAGAYGIASASSSSSPAVPGTTPTAIAKSTPTANAGSNARSGPATGGTLGTVSSVSKSSLTLTTAAGQRVTVGKTASTSYRKGTSSAAASAVTKGDRVLVLGTTSGTSITATQVIVQTTGSAAATSSAAKVIPFQRGAPATSKTVGQIPANYRQGSGSIVSGTAANKATEAALASYPGGVIDRVVKLSNGQYEVHNIGVNWPHHIFVSQSFEVIGAN